MERRNRNVAHAWWDKQAVRFLKKHLKKRWYRKIRDVYLALCEIESDYAEGMHDPEKGLRDLLNTTARYAGMDRKAVGQCARLLRGMGLIEYGVRRDPSKKEVIGSYVNLFKFNAKESLASIQAMSHKPVYGTEGIWALIKNTSKEVEKNKNSLSEKVNNKTTPVGGLSTAKQKIPDKSREKALSEFYGSCIPLPLDLAVDGDGISLIQYLEPFEHRKDFDKRYPSHIEEQIQSFYFRVINKHWKGKVPPGSGFRKMFLRACRSGVMNHLGLKIMPKEQWQIERLKKQDAKTFFDSGKKIRVSHLE